jgi:menaquinone-dependent protoporphyrinogen oxidase
MSGDGNIVSSSIVRGEDVMSTCMVAYASKMGATREIAEAVGAELLAADHRVSVESADNVRDVRGYDTVVLGSAVYGGRWRGEAVRFLRRHADVLKDKRVWLFHSGPCGRENAGELVDPPRNVARLAERIGTVPPMTFGGRLEPQTAKGFLAKRMAVGRLAGDYRDWDAIRRWARMIAGQRSTAAAETAAAETAAAETAATKTVATKTAATKTAIKGASG